MSMLADTGALPPNTHRSLLSEPLRLAAARGLTRAPTTLLSLDDDAVSGSSCDTRLLPTSVTTVPPATGPVLGTTASRTAQLYSNCALESPKSTPLLLTDTVTLPGRIAGSSHRTLDSLSHTPLTTGDADMRLCMSAAPDDPPTRHTRLLQLTNPRPVTVTVVVAAPKLPVLRGMMSVATASGPISNCTPVSTVWSLDPSASRKLTATSLLADVLALDGDRHTTVLDDVTVAGDDPADPKTHSRPDDNCGDDDKDDTGPKSAPTSVTGVPPLSAPREGRALVTDGVRRYSNLPAVFAESLADLIVTVTRPSACAGDTHSITLSDTMLTLVAAAVPNMHRPRADKL